MTDGSPPGRSSFAKSWVYPILFIVAIAAGTSFLMWKFGDMPFLLSFVGLLAVLTGTLAYSLGMFSLYEAAATRLGWRCTTGPQARPAGSASNVDIVILGDFRGRPFTLYREKSSGTGRSRVEFRSTMDWTGQEIRLPAFRLHVSSSLDATAERFLGVGTMLQSISGALGFRKEGSRVEFAPDSRLARRSELSAMDASAAYSFFSPHLCDQLDSLISEGSIAGEPGRLLISYNGFPYPWKLEKHLAQGDEIRRILVG